MSIGLAVIGAWLIVDGILSFFVFTQIGEGRSWLRDHPLKLLEIGIGVLILVLGLVIGYRIYFN